MYAFNGLGVSSPCASMSRFYNVESGAMPDKPCPSGTITRVDSGEDCREYYSCMPGMPSRVPPEPQGGVLESNAGLFLAAAGVGIALYLAMRG